VQTVDYCREIESYLCQKNDGHLIRVVGPSFELVSGWAASGVPLKIAFSGIDRCVERYYRKGPRRRPVKIDFCEADVLDVFDEWRRALGLTGTGGSLDAGAAPADPAPAGRGSTSLPAHLERAVLRLTDARTRGSLGPAFDKVIDAVASELDRARGQAGGLRGDARKMVVARLDALDAELLAQARASVDDALRADLAKEADEELAGYRAAMDPAAFARARGAAIDRLLRERYRLPILRFTP
jgi:hypothetical protein